MKTSSLLAVLGLASQTFADPTWPSSIDELEEIMFQTKSFRSRKFADTVDPCSNEASGPGRQNAAEWLRTAFHDMSTANSFLKRGGLDGSLQYELNTGENKGPGLKTTMEFMAPFISSKSSFSDLVAMGVYTSVRACGGPAVPIRAGRKDATGRGSIGVPQPQNSVQSFRDQFTRMGFTNEEMIQVTACGHTLGGVHSEEFPEIVPAGTGVDGQISLDGTVAVFDNRVVTEYLDGTTKNPLVVGPSVQVDRHADFKVYNSDGNVTVEALTDNDKFKQVCKTVLQKMIDVVPAGVTLSDPIKPYEVKPVALQLTLVEGGRALSFTGYIRVRTTEIGADAIKNVVITYKNRKGESECGSNGCTITTTVQGVSQGFDDTFAFFPIEAEISASTGVSSFVITVNYADGTKKEFDNNGNTYALQDAVLLQMPQSCVLGSSGALTVTAAVRNDRVSAGASIDVSYKIPQSNSPVPRLMSASVALNKGDCAGEYTFFTADWTIPGGRAYEAHIDVKNGDYVDAFKTAVDVGGTCRQFANPASCGSSGGSSSSTAATVSETPSPEPTASSTTTSTTTTSSEEATPTVHHREAVGGYRLVSCWHDYENGIRALSGPQNVQDDMTLESCMSFCDGYDYFGTEYGVECFCGNSLHDSSKEAPTDDCDMPCGGDKTEYCGAGNRLELYSTTATRTTATPTATPSHVETVGDYALVGCWTELQGGRALRQDSTSSSDMTNQKCAQYCGQYRYFGTEYGLECYCGSHVATDTESAPLEDCGKLCGGDDYAFCGGPSRLSLYMNPDIQGGDPEQPLTVGNYTFEGCYTDSSASRALDDKRTAGSEMTNEVCAAFCEGFAYFGTEYGQECYCGNEISEDAQGKDSTECSMICKGSVLELCGDGNRLSVYKRKEEEILISSDA
ncbi:heme peroxidase [Emericellopsis atlantica]|uniref:Heme peroxidase n=1 Tax=Emericellopsis atlantica TaxID=2614577 RepID=A0A9P7ZPA1_9HYPO|nr:heme peroxidase [Emericellopsis atlantica]KAG9255332.1 heme peroxidase [Emericellopsis atlantica]